MTDVHALDEDMFVCTAVGFGRDEHGGAFEVPTVAAGRIGGDGRIVRGDWYAPEQLGDALDRFRRRNAATRRWSAFVDAYVDGTWEAHPAEFFASDLVLESRRPGVGYAADGGDRFAELIRATRSVWPDRPLWDVRAVRSDDRALIDVTWHGADAHGGRTQMRQLFVCESDAHGRLRRLVTFDADADAAAFGELDR